MPSLKQRLRQLELEREAARRHQLTDIDTHRLLELVRSGRNEAEIASDMHIDLELARQAVTQLMQPVRPSRRGRSHSRA